MADAKNIVITGGSRGLGKALAIDLSAKGHKVVILSSDEDKLKDASIDAKCTYKVCDISDWSQVEKTVKAMEKELGSINVLINNAGLYSAGKIEDTSPDDIQRMFDVNVVGTLFMTKAVVPGMKQKSDGYIININSQAGFYTKSERVLYTGGKWALTGITKVLQTELASSNIKVTGLYPGAMEQSMAAKSGPQANSIKYQEMIDGVDFVLSRGPNTVVPELGIKDLDN